MNQFIEQLDALLDEHGITQEQEEELIEYIFSNSNYQNVNEFAKSNLNYYDALNMVQSDDAYSSAVTEWLNNHPDELTDQLLLRTDMPVERVAYTLAYQRPEVATQLLDELLYYRSKRRI